MNELQVFNYGGDQVRVIERDGDPWFVGKDVAEVLGYADAAHAILDHVDDVDRINSKTQGQNVPELGQRGGWLINESGLYSLIMSSKLPTAKQFRHWVTSEVLPCIRKHGVYATPITIDQMIADPDYAIGLLQALKAEQVKLQAEKEKNALMQPKADYFDALVERNTLTGVRETAKELNVRPKEFTTYLLEHGYVYRDHKTHLQPYAQYVENGLFVLKECKNDKNSWSGTQMLITPKGRETFRLLLEPAA